MNKVVLITGASSGIGMTTSKMLLKAGYTVYCAARRTELMKELEDLGGHPLYLDLTDDSSIQKCVQELLSAEGKIDILINNAGYASGGSLEEVEIEAAKRQFDVNVFGLIRLTQLCTPSMRAQKSGRIINISSMAGFFSTAFMGWYHAAKYSVEALSDALRNELKPFNIKVSIIEPGLTKTNWGIIAADSLLKKSGNGDYKENALRYANYYRANYNVNSNISDPIVISKAILHAVTSKKPKIRYKVGKYCKSFIFIRRHTPDGLFDFITNSIMSFSKKEK